jgi:hypothetical protein
MKTTIIAALLLLFTAPALCAEAGSADMPSITTTQTVKLTAEVVAVDPAQRTVTLRGPEGGEHTLDLPEAKRLDEVAVGDTVLAEYLQQLTVELVAGSGAPPGRGSLSTRKAGPASEPPGGVVTETEISMATVSAIDLENGTFRLQWDDGEKEYVARDPENLKKAKVGDYVMVTYSQALALQLQAVEERF